MSDEGDDEANIDIKIVAGLIHGRVMGLPFEVAGRMASLLGAWQVEFNGTQNLDLNVELFKERYEREFGSAF